LTTHLPFRLIEEREAAVLIKYLPKKKNHLEQKSAYSHILASCIVKSVASTPEDLIAQITSSNSIRQT
jgi:hypothetical protein